MSSIQRLIVRFEDFEVHLETGEVWKAGRPLKVQDQPFKILAALLERPGQIVTREELRQRIWAEKNFGDFDHAINLALAKLRATLGDSADVPHLIETLPRRGYRFIAPLKVQSNPLSEGDSAPGLGQTVLVSVNDHPAMTVGRKLWLTFGALAMVVLAAVALLRFLAAIRQPTSPASEIVPLISMPGGQRAPALSPDGSEVAFDSQGPHPGIYVVLIGGSKPLQLTDNGYDDAPVWSPDGRQIAFARFDDSGKQKTLFLIPALGGSIRRVYAASAPTWEPCNKMDWSPDGKSLVFPEAFDNGTKTRLVLLSLADLTTRALTFPLNQQSDCAPAFSPDNATIAFTRSSLNGFVSDLYVMRVGGGQPLRLTTANSGGQPAWTQDGSEIVFASPAKGFRSLWRISALGGIPQRVAGPGDADEPSISHRGNRLAYHSLKQSDSIWRIDLNDERHVSGPPVRLLTGRGFVWRPSYSPDGKQIAFESDRMGYSDIWICDSDGSNCSQLTDLHGISGTARWSPNGHYISFESLTQDYYEVGVVEVPDGIPHVLSTFPGVNNGAPNWSRDGESIYFYSSRDPGLYQLWKMPSKGGAPVQLTKNGGIYAIESMDRRFLFYSKFDEPAIWKKSLETGQESQLPIHPCWWSTWDVARGGIYFLNLKVGPYGRIDFFDFADGQSVPVFTIDKPSNCFSGLAVSPDGKSLLFGQSESAEDDIMVMNNFR